MFWKKKKNTPPNVESKSNIIVTIIPDEFHIDFAGKRPNGDQVFVTQELHRDSGAKVPTDYIVEYVWDSMGNIKTCEINEIGVRGEYDKADAFKRHENIKEKYSDLILGEIQIKPCSRIYKDIEFGFIPREEDEYVVVQVMPGNCLCFTEPFDGRYDT